MSKAARPDRQALFWSINAMQVAGLRVDEARYNGEAFAAIGEAVWWVTVVDKTLEKTEAYKRVVDGGQYIGTDNGPFIRNILRGLRSVRNRIGHEVTITDFVNFHYERKAKGLPEFRVTTWKAIGPPARNVAHALDNHQAYVDAMEGERVWEAFSVAGHYLGLIADSIYPAQWPASLSRADYESR